MSASIEKVLFSRRMAGSVGSLVDIVHHDKIRVTAFGRSYNCKNLYNYKDVDWSFRPFQKNGDGAKDLMSARLLPKVATSLHIKSIVAPKPIFGTTACFSNECTESIPFKHEDCSVVLKRGVSADVCSLSQGETFGITVGGCPVGWVYNLETNGLVVAHMGLECLIDKKRLFGGKLRQVKSVIQTMMQELALGGGDTSNVRAGFAFPISPHDYTHEWNHPVYGEKNQLLCEYLVREFGNASVLDWVDATKRRQGCISLAAIICRQFADEGIPPEYIKGFTAPSGCDLEGKPLWYDTRGPFGRDARNLVLVTAL